MKTNKIIFYTFLTFVTINFIGFFVSNYVTFYKISFYDFLFDPLNNFINFIYEMIYEAMNDVYSLLFVLVFVLVVMIGIIAEVKAIRKKKELLIKNEFDFKNIKNSAGTYFFFFGFYSIGITTLLVTNILNFYLPFALISDFFSITLIQIAIFFLLLSKRYLPFITVSVERRKIIKTTFWHFLLGNAISLIIFLFYITYVFLFTDWSIF